MFDVEICYDTDIRFDRAYLLAENSGSSKFFMFMCIHTHMVTKTITITLDAYNRLKQLKKDKNESFSELITRITPEKRKLSEILAAYEPDEDLAMSITSASHEMRSSRMREVKF